MSCDSLLEDFGNQINLDTSKHSWQCFNRFLQPWCQELVIRSVWLREQKTTMRQFSFGSSSFRHNWGRDQWAGRRIELDILSFRLVGFSGGYGDIKGAGRQYQRRTLSLEVKCELWWEWGKRLLIGLLSGDRFEKMVDFLGDASVDQFELISRCDHSCKIQKNQFCKGFTRLLNDISLESPMAFQLKEKINWPTK